MKNVSNDLVGNVLILRFHKFHFNFTKKCFAKKMMKQTNNITTVLEKTDNITGELRIPKLKYLIGEKTFETSYRENGCTFNFDLSKTYFSPRLSNERNVISDMVVKLCKKNKTNRILIMFAGVCPYPIVIAKKLKKMNFKYEIFSNELNKEANIYAAKNVRINKVQDNFTFVNGDAKKLSSNKIGKFDIILMPRPNLDNTFLDTAIKLSKNGTTIFYHGFGTKEKVLDEIKKNTKGKIGKIQIRKAGDIAPHKYRWQAIFKTKLK